MKNCRVLSVVLLTGLLIQACNMDQHHSGKAEISGRIKGLEGGRIYLSELDIHELVLLDSLALENNRNNFSFRFNPSETGFYVIGDQEGNHYVVVVSPGDRIEIIIEETGYNVNGSEDSRILKEYATFTNRNLSKIRDLNKTMIENTHLDNFPLLHDSINMLFDSIKQMQYEEVTNLIHKNPGSLAALFMLNQSFGKDLLLDEENDYRYFSMVDSALQKNYNNNKHAIDHHKRVTGIREKIDGRRAIINNTSIGSAAPDFTLPGPDGHLYSLSSLKGKYVVLQFWASWSGRSRKQNTLLRELYEKYKSRGLGIFSVSLDHNREMWMNAIGLDTISWIQVSDLNYPHSAIQKIYLIEDLPYCYLLDKKGKIIAKGLSNDDLSGRIHELLE